MIAYFVFANSADAKQAFETSIPAAYVYLPRQIPEKSKCGGGLLAENGCVALAGNVLVLGGAESIRIGHPMQGSEEEVARPEAVEVTNLGLKHLRTVVRNLATP
jgi:hypothetical protein